MRRASIALLLALCALPVPTPALAAPPSVELVELPQQLTLPLPEGSNRLFEVRVSGTPQAIWMSATAESPPERRLALQPMGKRWVFNLGDPRVATVVAGARQFQVFATFADGRRAESLPVQFVTARPAPVEVRIKTIDGRALPAGFGQQWITPRDAAALDFTWAGSGQRRPITLVAGEERVVVTPGPDGAVTLALGPPLRAAWQAAGSLAVLDADGDSIAALTAAPERLALDGPTTLRVVQRHSAPLPGSREYLRLHLGDISGGKVTVSITADDGTTLVDQRVAREGDRVEFALADGRYVLRVDRLVNMLVGDDHAEFSIEPATAAIEAGVKP